MDKEALKKMMDASAQRIADAWNKDAARASRMNELHLRKDILLAILATGTEFTQALTSAKVAIEFVNDLYDREKATHELQAFFADLESGIEHEILYDGDGNERNQTLEEMLAYWWPIVKPEFARLIGMSADPVMQCFGKQLDESSDGGSHD